MNKVDRGARLPDTPVPMLKLPGAGLEIAADAVSYTHLTLPTSAIV